MNTVITYNRSQLKRDDKLTTLRLEEKQNRKNIDMQLLNDELKEK